jgi:hypothetical protein
VAWPDRLPSLFQVIHQGVLQKMTGVITHSVILLEAKFRLLVSS